MDNDSILEVIYQVLKESSDVKTKEGWQRFFKEPVKSYGIKAPAVRKISAKYFKCIKNYDKSEIFAFCEELLKSGYLEEHLIACDWSYYMRNHYELDDFFIFENWLNLYVNNWASCDTLCNHTIGTFIEMYPNYLPDLIKWTGSNNRWVRRGAAVTLIIPARKGKFLNEIFQIADNLLTDKDDLVQKGYGWMLKTSSESHMQEIFEYVIKNKNKMPRTALRYSIEKMPPELKKEAMKK